MVFYFFNYQETQVEGEDVSKVDDGNETHGSAGENGNSDRIDKKLEGQHRGSWSQRDAGHRGNKKVISITT